VANEFPPVVEDMSIYVLPGRVRASPDPARGYTYVGRAYDDAADAERLGFHRMFLSERHALKDAGAVLGGIAARTTRLGVGTGAVTAGSRHPLVLAGFGATMQALNGPRMVLGLGRGDALWYGLAGYEGLVDFARILKRLWAGETVDYRGPAGDFAGVKMDDKLEDVPPPKVWYFALGAGPKAARAAADPAFDGIALYPFLTPAAVARAVNRLRAECERVGRDPETLHIAHCVSTAPDLDDDHTRAITASRLVTYLGWPGFGDHLVKANGWDPDIVRKLRAHPQFRGLSDGVPVDQEFHRIELLEPSRIIPDSWIEETCGVGSAAQAVERIAALRAQGPVETILYGSTPAQNAELIRLWRERGAESHPPSGTGAERRCV
jgi:5,10-methylenetetrahydromethanopterin reductase